MTWAMKHMTTCALGMMTMIQTVLAQPIRTLTMILSVCSIPPSIDHSALSKVLLRQPGTKTTNLQDMIDVCSNKKASFTTKIVKNPVYIPCATPRSYVTPQCDVHGWAAAADKYASQTQGIQIQTYDSIIYVLPQGNLCGFGGLGYMGPCEKGSPCKVWISGQIPDKIAAYFHELGHNLGLSHASYMNDQYGDLTDTMGYCCNIRCFAAPHSHLLGWSKPKYRFDVPVKHHSDMKLLHGEYVVVYDRIRAERTYIQFRNAKNGTYERDITSTSVNIYTMPEAKYSITNFEAMLWIQGHMWQNTYATKVTLLGVSNKMALVRVEPTSLTTLFDSTERVPL